MQHNTVQCKCVLDTLNTNKTQKAHTIAHGNPDTLAQPCCDQCKQKMSRRKQLGGHTIAYCASSKHYLPVLSARTIHQTTCNHNHHDMSLFRPMRTQANCAFDLFNTNQVTCRHSQRKINSLSRIHSPMRNAVQAHQLYQRNDRAQITNCANMSEVLMLKQVIAC